MGVINPVIGAVVLKLFKVYFRYILYFKFILSFN